MLQLLSPLALCALAALAIPAVLHLWRRPAKTIRVGTLSYFTGSAVRRLNKLRWRERLLLAVRLLLLTLLALLLAQLVWRARPSTKPQKWALLEPGLELRGEAEKRWQELRKAGYEARSLGPGFPRAAANDSSLGTSESPDTWSLLREVDARLPDGSAVAVFSSDLFASFRGARPRLQHCTVEWIHALAAPNQEQTWLESVRLAAASEGGSRELRGVIGRSTAERTEYLRQRIPAEAGKTPLPPPFGGWSIEVQHRNEGAVAARLVPANREAGEWMSTVSPRTLRVALLHDAERAEDARYVEAALRAVVEQTGDAIVVNGEVAAADWIFWLNDQPSPAELLQATMEREANLITDAEGGADATSRTMTFGDGASVELLRRTTVTADAGATVWSDSFGVPLLTIARKGAGRHWRFFSRFHPDWNALPRSSALPAALRSILAADGTSRFSAHDFRSADAAQVAPTVESGSTAAPIRIDAEPETIDLHQLGWLLCVALFIAERLLSHGGVRAAPKAMTASREREPESVMT